MNCSDEQVSSALRRVLDALNPVPAYVIGHRWNYLAWNAAVEYVFLLSKSVPPYEHNAVWRIFVYPEYRNIHNPKWEQAAQKVLEEFRADGARYADEEWFKRLIVDLQRVSPEFRAWWPRHDLYTTARNRYAEKTTAVEESARSLEYCEGSFSLVNQVV